MRGRNIGCGCGIAGGVEFGLISTSRLKEVAINYLAKQKGTPIVLEIDMGQEDRGADLSWLSQYPGESKILFPPLSNLEVMGGPQMEVTDSKGLVQVFQLRLNANIKSLTVDELVQRRKNLHLAALNNLLEETKRDLQDFCRQALGLCNSSGCEDGIAEQVCDYLSKFESTVLAEFETVLKRHEVLTGSWFDEVFCCGILGASVKGGEAVC